MYGRVVKDLVRDDDAFRHSGGAGCVYDRGKIVSPHGRRESSVIDTGATDVLERFGGVIIG